MGINRVLTVLGVLALTSCGQSPQEMASNTPTTKSPWHSLTEKEINEAAAAASYAFGTVIVLALKLSHGPVIASACNTLVELSLGCMTRPLRWPIFF
jgi:hypothetical protein